MKKIILLSASILLSLGTYAQKGLTTNKTLTDSLKQVKHSKKTAETYQEEPMDPSHIDCVMMKDGKMMIVRNGVMMIMKTDIILSNGTKIMPDGTIIRKDGSRSKIKEGNCIDVSSKLLPV